MSSLGKKIKQQLTGIGLSFMAVTANADTIITFHNPFLDKDFEGVNCTVRKKDMCAFGTSIDGNKFCNIDDLLQENNGNLKQANGVAKFANYEHGAVFHKGDCIGQHTQATVAHIYNSAATVIRINNKLNASATMNAEDRAKLESERNRNLRSIEKFIKGARGEKDSIMHMLEIAKKNGGRLDDPSAFISTLSPFADKILESYKNNDMRGIVNETIKILQKQSNVFIGECAIIDAEKQCNAAELSH